MSVRAALQLALLAAAVCVCAASTGPQPTQFKGNAKIVKGAPQCRRRCAALGMDLAGMVTMGEYSEGCICKVRPHGSGGTTRPLPSPPSAPDDQDEARDEPTPPISVIEGDSEDVFLAAGAGAAIAALEVARRNAEAAAEHQRQQRQRQQQQQQYKPYQPYKPPTYTSPFTPRR
jgi:hypothetical protein